MLFRYITSIYFVGDFYSIIFICYIITQFPSLCVLLIFVFLYKTSGYLLLFYYSFPIIVCNYLSSLQLQTSNTSHIFLILLFSYYLPYFTLLIINLLFLIYRRSLWFLFSLSYFYIYH